MTFKKYYLLVILLFTLSGHLYSQEVNAEAFEQGIKGSDVQVLDVRTRNEFKAGHLPNALQADWTKKEEFKERVQYLDKQKPVYLYCLSGGRSTAAAQWLKENGYAQVIEMQGGINAWKEAGKTVEVTSPTKELSVSAFEKAANASPLVLVDVGAEWCPPCKKMEPVIHQFLTKNPTVKLLKIDGGNDKTVMKMLKTNTLPTFILLRNGKEIWRKQGITTVDELVTALNPE